MNNQSELDLRKAPSAAPPLGVIGLQVAALLVIVLVAASSRTPPMRRPWEPLLVAAIGLAMAQCSLGAIWWAVTKSPSYLKTLVAVVACAVLWGMLLAVLNESRDQPDRAAGWAGAFATQFVLIALSATLLQARLDFRRTGLRHRYTILSLLLWTTSIAFLLAGGRWISARYGWTPLNFFSWEYFRHLQAIAIANAVSALALSAGWRMITSGPRFVIYCGAIVVSSGPAMLAVLWGPFGANLGASLLDIVLLSLVHAGFVALTLVVVELSSRRSALIKPKPEL